MTPNPVGRFFDRSYMLLILGSLGLIVLGIWFLSLRLMRTQEVKEPESSAAEAQRFSAPADLQETVRNGYQVARATDVQAVTSDDLDAVRLALAELRREFQDTAAERDRLRLALDAELGKSSGQIAPRTGVDQDDARRRQAAAERAKVLLAEEQAAFKSGGFVSGGGLTLTQDQEKESGITWEWPTSPYWLSAGSTLPCILDSGIRSEHRATIVARIPVTIFDSLTGRIPVIEADSVVIGQYQGATYGESSIAPIWERLVMALTKAEIPLNGWRGADATGMAGLKGEVDHKWLPWIGSIFFSSMLEAGAASVGVLGADRVQQASGMVAQDLAGQASGKISRNANLSPTHIIAPGTHCSIPLVRGVDLQPQALEVKR